jgi:GT2 family glycosyltransferase
VVVAVVTWNSAATIKECLKSLTQQEEFRLGVNLFVVVADNGSSDDSVAAVRQFSLSTDGVRILELGANFGFAGANNRIVTEFLRGSQSHLLLLNADCALAPTALSFLVARAADIVTPLLLRSDSDLRALQPHTIDAAGMTLTSDLRHFDRGSGEVDSGQFSKPEPVFGGTGACLLFKRNVVEQLLLDGADREHEVDRIFPVLARGRSERAQLFDEAFFAYREDADLCWRASLLGYSCWFDPRAVGYHQRRVTPERRADLPAFINRCGVRNRFLLQLNNIVELPGIATILRGLLLRNIIVVLGVLLYERGSRGALLEVLKLLPRAMRRRETLLKTITANRTGEFRACPG